MKQRRVAPLLIAAALAGDCGGTRGAVSVPDVRFAGLPTAFDRLRAAHVAVRVPYFPKFGRYVYLPGGDAQLDSYVVVAQVPRPGRSVPPGEAVTLAVAAAGHFGPLGSLAVPKRHPATARVPDLVGRTALEAWRVAGEPWKSGVWLRVDRVAPLENAPAGEQALRVVSQSRRAGTLVPFGGILRHGVDLSRATLALSLGARGESAGSAGGRGTEADRAARAALSAVAGSTEAGPLLEKLGNEAIARSCSLSTARPHGGSCLAAVDLSGETATVYVAEAWGHRAERTGFVEWKPEFTHLWTFHLAAGNVTSVQQEGDPLPE